MLKWDLFFTVFKTDKYNKSMLVFHVKVTCQKQKSSSFHGKTDYISEQYAAYILSRDFCKLWNE